MVRWFISGAFALCLGTSGISTCAEAPKRAIGVTGNWDSSFGLMTLKMESGKGNKAAVTGFWIQDKDKKGIIKSGSFDRATSKLEFTYHQNWNNQTGKGHLTLAADKRTLKGTWEQTSGKGKWTLTRIRGNDLASRIDSVIDNAGIKSDEPGVAVMVVEAGKVSFMKCYGMANVKEKKPLATHTPIELASLSKLFTAQLIMILHDRGLLAFEDDAQKYIPELPVYDKKYPVRVIDLLHHASGLPLYTSFAYPKGRNPIYVGLEDYAEEFTNQRGKFPLLFPSGTRYDYSNTNYMLLALIAQRVTKKSFGTALHDEVFAPLGMKNAWVYESPTSPPKDPKYGYYSARGYHQTTKDWQENRKLVPDGNEFLLTCGDGYVWASIEDLVKLDAGFREGKLIKPATIKQAVVPSKTRDGKTNDYGFGLELTFGDKGRLRTIGHLGGNNGVRTAFYRDIQEDRSIAVLCNRGDIEPTPIWNSIDRLCRAMSYKGK